MIDAAIISSAPASGNRRSAASTLGGAYMMCSSARPAPHRPDGPCRAGGGAYPKGVTITDMQIAALPLDRHDFHPTGTTPLHSFHLQRSRRLTTL